MNRLAKLPLPNCHCNGQIVQALVRSHLDGGNAVLHGLPATITAPFRGILHVTAGLIQGLKKYDHITPILMELHWLPLPACTIFKTSCIIYKVITTSTRNYLAQSHLAHHLW